MAFDGIIYRWDDLTPIYAGTPAVSATLSGTLNEAISLGTNLSYANIVISATDLNVNNIICLNLSGANLSYAKISGLPNILSISGAPPGYFIDADFSHAIINNVDFISSDFTRVNLSGATFVDTVGNNFITLRGSSVPPIDGNTNGMIFDDTAMPTYVYLINFDSLNFNNTDFSDSALLQGQFKNCNFATSGWNNTSAAAELFSACDFVSNRFVNFSLRHWYDTIGATFRDCNFTDSEFVNLQGTSAQSFSACTFENVIFSNTNFVSASTFVECTFNKVTFTNCIISAGVFVNCTSDKSLPDSSCTGDIRTWDTNQLLYSNPTYKYYWKELLETAVSLSIDLTKADISKFDEDRKQINLNGAKLQGMIAPNSRFYNVDFTGASFDNANLTDSDSRGEYYLSFGNNNYNNVSFKNAILDGAFFYHAPETTLSGVNFTNASLNATRFYSDNSKFYKCIFDGVNFNALDVAVKVEYPEYDGEPLTYTPTSASYENCQMKNTVYDSMKFIYREGDNFKARYVFTDCDMTGAGFKNSIIYDELNTNRNIFTNCTLNNSTFRGAKLTKQIFNECVLNNSDFTEAILDNCEFTNIQMSGCTLPSSISGCNLSESNLQYSNMPSIQINNSILFNTDFNYSNMKGVNFSNDVKMDYIHLENADLTDAKINKQIIASFFLNGAILKNVDLTTCTLSAGNDEQQKKLQYDVDIATINYQSSSADYKRLTDKMGPLLTDYESDLKEYNIIHSEWLTAGPEDRRLEGELKARLVSYTEAENKAIEAYNKWDHSLFGSLNGLWDEVKIWRAARDARKLLYSSSSTVYFEYHAYWLDLDADHKIKTDVKNQSYSLYKPYEQVEKSTKQQMISDKAILDKAETDLDKAKDDGSKIYANFTNASLENATLYNVDASWCQFDNVNFANTKLSGANFSHSRIIDADFSGKDLRGCTFISATLSGTNFSKPTYTLNLNFTDSDLRGANFTGDKQSPTDLSNSIFDRCNMDGCLFTAPLKTTEYYVTDNIIVGVEAITAGTLMTSASFIDTKMRDTILVNAIFKGNKKMKGIILSGSDLTGADLSYVDMSACNLSEANMSNVIASGATFTSGTMQFANWSGSDLYQCDFDSSDMQRSTMESSKINDCTFKHTTLSGSDMSYSNIKHSYFNFSKMMESDMRYGVFASDCFADSDMTSVKTFQAKFTYPILDRAKFTFIDVQKMNLLQGS